MGKAGCYVDGKRVRIPSHLIKWALNTAPSRIVLANRKGKESCFQKAITAISGRANLPEFPDAETGERRKARKQDVVNTAIVADKLPNIDFVMSLSMISDQTPGVG